MNELSWLRHHQSRLGFGADYNPEQWPREVWPQDVRLMREAGVTVVSLAIFSWARLQPAEDRWDFAWLDEVMELLHEGGISVDLATATASPPPWLTTKHPEILPVNAHGETLFPGARQHWRPTSAVFREHALRLVRRLAERYGDHPALAAWHVSNELGCHNAYDYSDDAAQAFRGWLEDRYGTIDALNHAWGTAFWSQGYGEWAEIQPPRQAPTFPNPTQQLDFKRFSSWALLDYLRAERDLLRELTPGVPVTTNFMIMNDFKPIDYASWAGEVDFVANDHYVLPGPRARDELSFSANLTGNLAKGRPWFLMEHSTSAVNWQPVNTPKLPGELARDSLTHLAHGADAICFFQWRQSSAGAEKYHSAMVPQAGADSDLFREVAALGARLRSLSKVAGTSRVRAKAAIVFDWPSWWAAEADSHPTDRLRYKQEALDWYTAFLNLGLPVDVVPVNGFSGYDFVVAPILHLVSQSTARALESFVDGGGHLVTTYCSGIVDENDHFWPGAFPGALRDLLGVRIQEFAPLFDGDSVRVGELTGTMWTDKLDVVGDGVEVLAAYESGRPAITRRGVGTGSAAYVSTRLGPQGLTALLGELAARAGLVSPLPPRARGAVEVAYREGFTFLINRGDTEVVVDGLTVGPRDVAVVSNC